MIVLQQRVQPDGLLARQMGADHVGGHRQIALLPSAPVLAPAASNRRDVSGLAVLVGPPDRVHVVPPAEQRPEQRQPDRLGGSCVDGLGWLVQREHGRRRLRLPPAGKRIVWTQPQQLTQPLILKTQTVQLGPPALQVLVHVLADASLLGPISIVAA